MERSGMMAGFRATRAIRDSRLRSPATGSRTNLVLSVRSATFSGGETERQRRVASGKWPCSRLMPIVLAGRSLAAYCGVLPVRSIAGYCWSWPDEVSRPFLLFGGARAVLTVSPVCGRRNEAKALRRRLRIAAAEWNGCKAGESVVVRGRNRADTWQRKCRLGEAGLLSFPVEERSDEVSMPDTALKIIRQPERLECKNDIRKYVTVIRARGVAKGPPSVTSVNPRWRPGARP